MQQTDDSVPSHVRDLLDKLSGNELLATQRYLELVMETRGIDPYAHLDDFDEDDLDAKDRAALDASIARGLEEMRQGKGLPAEEVLDEMRKRR